MTESIFGTETPVVINATDAVNYSMGTQFVPAVDGTATHGKFYFPTTAQSGVTVGIFQVSGAVTLGTKAFPGTPATGWQTVAFDTPISLTAGTPYRVAVWIPSHYNATVSYPWPKTSTGGNLTAPTGNGYFLASTGSLVMPTTASGNSASYFADLIFEPTGAPTGVTPTGIAVPLGLGTPISALNLSAAPSGLAAPVALGTPATALNRSAAPSGLALPIALGNPSTVASATPSGLAIPIALGQPSSSGTVIDPSSAGGSWWSLVATNAENARYAREEKSKHETECPNDGTPLVRNPRTGRMQCSYDGYVARR